MKQNKVNVLIYPSMPVPNACDLYRHINPFKYSDKIEFKTAYEIPLLEYRDKETNQIKYRTADPKDIRWADVILFVRYYNKNRLDLVNHLIEVIKKEGKPIVYETDDLLHKVEQNTYSKKVGEELSKMKDLSTMEASLLAADAVTVSTEPLKEYYSTMTDKPIHVLNNYYDPEMWKFESKKCKKSKKFRIGWSGGENHYHKNFSILAEPFNYLHKKYQDKIEFVVFCGKSPNQDWFPGHRNPFEFEFEFHTGEDIYDYPKKLYDLNLDLGIVVVEDNEFSSAKSNIKWMEYGLCGVPCIASDVGPYKTTTALKVKNLTSDWIEAIETMMTNSEKYGIIKETTLKEIPNWNIKNHYHKWEKVYLEIANR